MFENHGPDMDLLSSIFGDIPMDEAEYQAYKKPVEDPEYRDEIALSGKQEVGEIIEHAGDRWLVVESFESDGRDTHDEDPDPLPAGWWSSLVRLTPERAPMLEELARQYKAGKMYMSQLYFGHKGTGLYALRYDRATWTPEGGFQQEGAPRG
jgi:hypothetical protein